MKGGGYDISRAASLLLDDFRGGKLGRITLEFPSMTTSEEEKHDCDPDA